MYVRAHRSLRVRAQLQLYQEIAEMYEEDTELDKAVEYYRKAADLFEGESSKSAADKCLTKIAMLSGSEGRYDDAIEAFETVAQHCLENNLLKFNAKGHLLNASELCVVLCCVLW